MIAMHARSRGNRSNPNWTAVGAGIGAALGAATHAMAEWLSICLAAGALADALVASRGRACATARCVARGDGRSA
jgi:hypothetical protein